MSVGKLAEADTKYACAECLIVAGVKWLVLVPQFDLLKCSMCGDIGRVYHIELVRKYKYEGLA